MRNFISVLTHMHGRKSQYTVSEIRIAFNEYLSSQIENNPVLDAMLPKKVMTEVVVENPKSKLYKQTCMTSLIANKDGLCIVWFEGKKEHVHKNFLTVI